MIFIKYSMKNDKIHINETTNSSLSNGSYNVPLRPGVRIFKKIDLEPFTIPVSKYDDAQLAYDSYDGQMSLPKKEIDKIEKNAIRISREDNNTPSLNDDDGGILNPDNIKEGWVEITDDLIVEDLAVWFGKKKKKKGSSQPQGPWVNICRKKEGGGHPPCGRGESESKGYPKCRAVGVARKMTDSQKKAACQQKRKAEKKDTQTGKGQKPIMTSYKPRNESLQNLIKNILREFTERD